MHYLHKAEENLTRTNTHVSLLVPLTRGAGNNGFYMIFWTVSLKPLDYVSFCMTSLGYG